MTLKEIVEKFNALEIYKKRKEKDDYCELVFYSKDTAKWNAILIEIFGQAIKAAGKKTCWRRPTINKRLRRYLL